MITLLLILNLACAAALFLSLVSRKGETSVIWYGALYMCVAFGVFWLYASFGWPVLVVSLLVFVPESVKRGKQFHQTFFAKKNG